MKPQLVLFLSLIHISYKEKLKDDYFSDYGQKIYKKRAPITESIFGVLKTGRNYNGLKRLDVYKRQYLNTCVMIFDLLKDQYKDTEENNVKIYNSSSEACYNSSDKFVSYELLYNIVPQPRCV